MTALRRDIDRLAARLDELDRGGTRGVGAIQTQMTDLAKDVAEIKGETRAWQEAHTLSHAQEARDRVTARRWLIGVGVAGVASMAAALGLLVDIASHIHH